MAPITTPTRQSGREGTKRTSAIINMYGVTNDDDKDGDFTPTRKRGRMNEEGDTQSSEDAAQDEDITQDTLIDKITSPMVVVRTHSRATRGGAKSSVPSVENESDSDAITNRPKSAKARRTRGGRTIAETPTPPKRQTSPILTYGEKAATKPIIAEHQPNSSQVLSHRVKPGQRSGGPDRQSYDSSQTLSAEPGSQTIEPTVSADTRPVSPLASLTGRTAVSLRFYEVQNRYLQRRLAIVEGNSTTKDDDLLDADNERLRGLLTIIMQINPQLTLNKRSELARLENDYLNRRLNLYPGLARIKQLSGAISPE